MAASLPAIITLKLLSTMRAHPQLPPHTWYFVAGATLSTLNRPDQLSAVFKNAIGGDGTPELPEDEQLKVARRMREALVKGAAIVGLPKVCESPQRVFGKPTFLIERMAADKTLRNRPSTHSSR